jgi:hypothetical protein
MIQQIWEAMRKPGRKSLDQYVAISRFPRLVSVVHPAVASSVIRSAVEIILE